MARFNWTGEAPRDAVIRALDDKSPKVRVQALQFLPWAIDDLDVLATRLTEGLHDPDASVRFRAAKSLCQSRLDAEITVPPLTHAFNDESDRVRSQAAESIRCFGRRAEKSSPQLIVLLHDESQEVRRNALSAIGLVLESDSLLFRLTTKSLVEDPSARVRQMALWTLRYRLREFPGVVELELAALEDREAIVREAALSSLESGGLWKESDTRERLSDALQRLLEDEDSSVSDQARRFMEKINREN